MEINKKIVFIDMDGVLVDFDSGVLKTPPSVLSIYHQEEYDNIPHIFARMDPMKGGIEAFKALHDKYDIYILSTSPWNNSTALQDKLDWIKKYLGDLAKKKVIFSHHKELALGDYLIDDRPCPSFRGKQFLFGSTEYPDWESILKESL